MRYFLEATVKNENDLYQTYTYEITPIVQTSQKTEMKEAGCSSSLKSAAGTVSCIIRPSDISENYTLRANVLSLIAAAEQQNIDISFWITGDGGTDIIFTGKIDGNISQSSARVPDDITITAVDRSGELDKEISESFEFPTVTESQTPAYPADAGLPVFSTTEESVIGDIMYLAGFKHPYDDGQTDWYITESENIDDVIRDIVYDADSESTTTYRTIIDKILFEHCATIRCTPEGRFIVHNFKDSYDSSSSDAIDYIYSEKLQTSTQTYEYDGVKVKYSTLKSNSEDEDIEGKQRTIYVADLDNTEDDDGLLLGEAVAPHEYWPENGDIEKVYQEYNSDFLDYKYLAGSRKAQNSDLSLISARNVTSEFISDDNDAFTQPVVNDMENNPEIYPTKARFLYYNSSAKDTHYIKAFRLAGDVLYRNAIKYMTAPNLCTNPEDYTSTYIYTDDQARAFASWYVDWKKNMVSGTHTWTEMTSRSIYSLVKIQHPLSSTAFTAMIITKVTTWIGDTPQYKYTAVTVESYAEKLVSIFTRYVGSSAVQGEKGDTGAAGASYSGYISTNLLYVPSTADGYTKTVDGLTAQIRLIKDGTELTSGVTYSKTDSSGVTSTLSTDGLVTVTAMEQSASSGYILVTATDGTGTVTYRITLSRQYDTAEATLTLSGTYLDFYADDVPHNTTDNIIATVTYSGYSDNVTPVLKLGDTELALSNDQHVVYASDLAGITNTTLTLTYGSLTRTASITKNIDPVICEMTVTRIRTEYYADNVIHPSQAQNIVYTNCSGFSVQPILKIGGTVRNIDSAGTYTIPDTELDSEKSKLVYLKYGTEERQVTIYKVYDPAVVSLSLSKNVFGYYADNVPHDSNDSIIATVGYSGLAVAPSLMVDGTVVEMTDMAYSIPVTALRSATSITVKAYHSVVTDVYDEKTITKVLDNPVVRLVATSGQFHYDANDTVSPESITITPYTSGLSDSVALTFKVGGETKQFTDGKYILLPAMMTGTYISLSLTWETTTSEILIVKSYDGKVSTYQYCVLDKSVSPGKSAWALGIDPTAIGTDNWGFGESVEVTWSDTYPEEVASNECVWVKRKDPDGNVYIYRSTGANGENAGGIYCGAHTTAPTTRPDGSDLVDGDYYLDISDPTQPVPYRLSGGTWTAISSTDSDWSDVAAATAGDVAKYCQSLLSTNAYYAWFQNLSAVNGFINSLGTRKLTLTSGGEIKSAEWDTSGGTAGFCLPSNGDAIFNSGLFQGGIANGWSIFGGLELEIPSTMTQRELYTILRKAGVGTGAYFGVWYNDNAQFFDEKKSISPANMIHNVSQEITYAIHTPAMGFFSTLGSILENYFESAVAVYENYFLCLLEQKRTYYVSLMSTDDIETLAGPKIFADCDTFASDSTLIIADNIGTNVTDTILQGRDNSAVPAMYPHAYYHDIDNKVCYALGGEYLYTLDFSGTTPTITATALVCYDTDGTTAISGATAENTIISWYDSQKIRKCTWNGQSVWLYTFETGTTVTDTAWIAYSADMINWIKIDGTEITKGTRISSTEKQMTGYICPLAYNDTLYYFRNTLDTVTSSSSSSYTITNRLCSRPLSDLATETVIKESASDSDTSTNSAYSALNACAMDVSDDGVICYSLGQYASTTTGSGATVPEYLQFKDLATLYFYNPSTAETVEKPILHAGQVYADFGEKAYAPLLVCGIETVEWDATAAKFVVVAQETSTKLFSTSTMLSGFCTAIFYIDETGSNIDIQQFQGAKNHTNDYGIVNPLHEGYKLWMGLGMGTVAVTDTPTDKSFTSITSDSIYDHADIATTDTGSVYGFYTPVIVFTNDAEAQTYGMKIAQGMLFCNYTNGRDGFTEIPQITIDGTSDSAVPFTCERFYLRPTLTANSNALVVSNVTPNALSS